jgi:hypothetical protein
MKHVTFITLICVLLTFQFLPAQAPDTSWCKTYGDGVGQCLIETSDSCYVIVGHSNHWNGSDLRLIKANSDGDTIWTKTYGDISHHDFGYSIRQTADEGFIIVGSTASLGAGEQDVWLLKTDEYGDTLWTRTFGGDTTDVGQCIQLTKDGGFIIVGTTMSYGTEHGDVWLIKTNPNGDTLWTRTYGDTANDGGRYVIQTADSGYAIVGFTNSENPLWDFGDVWFIKTDPDGDTLWTNTFRAGYAHCDGRCVIETYDGYLISARNITTEIFGDLIKTDFSGDTLWIKHLHGAGFSICPTYDGNYLVAGFGVDFFGMFLHMLDLIDDSGNILCQNVHPACFRSVIQASDSSYVATGDHSYFLSLCKIPPFVTGLNQSADIITKAFSLSQNYPNPFNPSTTIEFDLPKTSEVTLKIFNILGEEVATLVSDRLSAGSYSYDWDANNLASGIYLYKLQTGDYVETRKMVLMR